RSAISTHSLLAGFLVEDVVGCVMHKCLIADVAWRCTARRWRDSSRGVHPLDKYARRQCVATGGSVLRSSHVEQDPGNRTRRDEIGVGGGFVQLGPYRARVAGVLPGGANRAIAHHRWIDVSLKRIRAEEVGCELLTSV